jgi:CheY-like chemotaxis protein
MPGKDGITLASQIRSALKATTPILFVSGDISEQTANRIRRLKISGHVQFLKKGEYNSTDLFDVMMAMLKEYSASTTMQEMKGRLSHLQENFGEGMAKITSFMTEIQSEPRVTQALCDAKVESIMKTLRKESAGIAVGKIKDAFKPEVFNKKVDAVVQVGLVSKIQDAITPEILEPKLEAALKPELALRKVRAAQAWKIAQYFLLVIFAGLCIFWGTMWNKAEHADAGVQALNIKHKQVIDTMQAQTKQIKVLFSHPRTRIRTYP